MKTNLASRIADTIIRYRLMVVLVFFAILAVAATGIPRFKIAASADTLLAKDNQLYIQSQLAQQTFSPDEFILVAYEPTHHEVFSEQTF
ncbi:RND family transporter, partial [Alteromonas sp. AMM-1]